MNFSLILFTVFIPFFAIQAAITVSSDFHGGNGIATSIDNANNKVSIQAEKKQDDYYQIYYYCKIDGFDISRELEVTVDAQFSGKMAYSYDQQTWQSVGGTGDQPKVYSHQFNSTPVYVAVGYPYTYNDAMDLVVRTDSSEYAETGDVAVSEQGRAVKYIKITDPTTENQGKKLIWMVCRQHAFEVQHSHWVEGFVEYLAFSEEWRARNVREKCIVYVVPVMDIDRVFHGATGKKPRYTEYDFNHSWGTDYWNAVAGVKDMITQTAAQNDFVVFIDNHSPWPEQNQFKFFCTASEGEPGWNKIEEFTGYHDLIAGYTLDLGAGKSTGFTADYLPCRVWAYENFPGCGIVSTIEFGWWSYSGFSLTIPALHKHGMTFAQAVSDYLDGAPGDIIVDNSDPECTFGSAWETSTTLGGYFGENYAHDGSVYANPDTWAKWTPALDKSGMYRIHMRWVSPGSPDCVPLEIKHENGIDDTGCIDQSKNGRMWNLMGMYELNNNEENYVKIYASDDGCTRADAVKFEYIGTAPGATALGEDNFSQWNMPGRGNAGTLTKENALFRVTDLRGRAIAENMSRAQVKNFMQSTDSALGAYIISVQSGNGIRSVKLYVK